MKVIKKVLASGLTVLMVPMKDSASVTVDVSVRAGSYYEDKNTSGISHFLEHMCFKGTINRPLLGQISRELDQIGAQANAATGNETTSYYVKARPRHVNQILDIVSDIYLHSTFPEIEIEKEKGVVCDEIAMYEDDPQSIASDLLRRTLYGDTTFGWDIAGTKENVRAFTRDAIIAYRTKHYVASKTIVTITGAIDPKDVLKKVTALFKPITSKVASTLSKKAPTLGAQHSAHKERDTEQTHIRIAFKGFARNHVDKYAVAILATVLGGGMSSRLFTKLREEMGVSYYIGASHRSYTVYGMFGVYTGVSNNAVEAATDAIRAECIRLTKEKVDDTELNKIKEMYTASIFMGLETSSALADYVSAFALNQEDILTPKQLEAKFRAVTPADIMRVAKTIFKNKEYVVTVGKSQM